MSPSLEKSALDRSLVFFLRIAMGWTFLYAGVSQLTNPHFSVAAFLSETKTFHDALAVFAAPAIAPAMTFIVEWGHTLIGLSLVTGCLVRLSSPFGVLLMVVYYCAHMDWPYIENHNNFIMDYHLVYGACLILLMREQAGLTFGVDALLAKLGPIEKQPVLKALFG